MMAKRAKEPTIFAGYIHDVRGASTAIYSICCEGPECWVCAGDPAAAKRANNKHFPWPDDAPPAKEPT